MLEAPTIVSWHNRRDPSPAGCGWRCCPRSAPTCCRWSRSRSARPCPAGAAALRVSDEPMLERLHNGEIDVGILALPVIPRAATRALYRGAVHRSAARRTGWPHATGTRRGPPRRDAAAAGGRALPARSGAGGLQPRGVHEKQDFRATSLETLRQMVATGAGMTLCRSWLSTAPTATPVVWCCTALRQARSGAPPQAPCGADPLRGAAIDALCKVIGEHAR